jgi:YVTN family beta-propeller protein
VGSPAGGVSGSPDGFHAYVSNFNGDSVTVIDTFFNTVADTITVGASPYLVAYNPAGDVVFVTVNGENAVKMIDTATNSVVGTIAVGDHPVGIAVSPDGGTIYVGNASDGTVSVISQVVQFPDLDLPELVGQTSGGVDVGGGGWLVIGGHFYKIPPRSPVLSAIMRAAAPHVARGVENRALATELQRVLLRGKQR